MQTTFILRAVNAQREVLGWTKVPVKSKGDGCLWAEQDFVAEGDVTGLATDLILHWQDVNVHTTVSLGGALPIERGKTFVIPLREPLIVLPSDPRPLPGVTVRSVDIGMATAGR